MGKQIKLLFKTIFSSKFILMLLAINVILFLVTAYNDTNQKYILSIDSLLLFTIISMSMNFIIMVIYLAEFRRDQTRELKRQGVYEDHIVVMFILLYMGSLFFTHEIFDIKIGTKNNNKVFLSKACLTKDNSSDKYIINAKTYNYGNILFKIKTNRTLLIKFTDCLKDGNNIALKNTIVSDNKIIKVELQTNRDFDCVKPEEANKYINFTEKMNQFDCLGKK